MFTDLTETLLNPYVVIYILIVFGGQILIAVARRGRHRQIESRRRAQGLPADVFLDHAERLSDRRREALLESGVMVGSIFLVPFILIMVAKLIEGSDTQMPEAARGLSVVFIGLLLWALFSATDVGKAFLGGLAFKTVAAFKVPFQVGDRVTLKGVAGKVVGFDTFFVTLQTANDDLVNIPTGSLWTETLVSANAGDRSSLCVMDFYLSPLVTAEKRQAAEDAIWDSIQASVYYDPSKPMQIYLAQKPEFIQLTAKAYVASTYNEPLFVSDVTGKFLDFASEKCIDLATPI